jgi:regulator of protease activity HflC (stomatin/prohibitin superfamily)
MGVQEYFAYDANSKPLARATTQRLFGWRRDSVFLRLYDRHGNLRLTEASAMAQQAEAEAEARRAADRRAQAEAEAREAADRRAQAEAEAREAANRRAQVLAEKLRSLGYDPDQI